MKPQRTTYDTSIKHLFRKQLETALPNELRKQIPKANIHRWRREADDKYFGAAINEIAKSELEMLLQFAEAKNFRRVFIAYMRLVRVMTLAINTSKKYFAMLRNQKENVVNAVERVRDTVSVNKAIKVFGISRSTYQSWLVQVKAKCSGSYFNLCRRMSPLQLLPKEVAAMKRLLTQFPSWPIRSVHWWAKNRGVVFASLSSWYKVNHLLGIRMGGKKNYRSQHFKPLKATRTNEIWHADVTIVRTTDRCKYYLYLLQDNFSRKILSWELSDKLLGVLRVKTIRDVYASAAITKPVHLVTDGGPENVNHKMNTFLSGSGINIHQTIALKDIVSSNSMVEAANKILKYRYLYPKPVATFSQLKSQIANAIDDFNNVRPHGVLNGYTPSEVYDGADITKVRYVELQAKAVSKRVEMNRKAGCGQCIS